MSSVTEEVRVVNERTGGEKGSKGLQMSYLPVPEVKEILNLYHQGAKKYAKHNWSRGFDWSLSYDALQRHAMDFWDGESHHEVVPGDPSTRCHHLASVVFHAIALMYFEREHPGLDDRLSTALARKQAEDDVDKALAPYLLDAPC